MIDGLRREQMPRASKCRRDLLFRRLVDECIMPFSRADTSRRQRRAMLRDFARPMTASACCTGHARRSRTTTYTPLRRRRQPPYHAARHAHHVIPLATGMHQARGRALGIQRKPRTLSPAGGDILFAFITRRHMPCFIAQTYTHHISASRMHVDT